MRKTMFLMGLLAVGYANAQSEERIGKVGVNTDTPQATMDINISNNASATSNQGLLLPRLTKARLAGITTPVKSTLVYVTDVAYTGTDARVAEVTSEGFYYYNGVTWQPMQKPSPRLDYIISSDGRALAQWFNKYVEVIDMNNYPDMAQVSIISSNLLQNSQVKKFVMKDGITDIGQSAFQNSPQMVINLPSSLITIGDYAFENNRTITSLQLPNLKSVGNNAFSRATSLTSISLPAATTIGGSAFSGATSLTSISLPAATTIGGSAFSGATSLTSINLPAVTTIESGAFRNISNAEITLGPNIKSIGSLIFGYPGGTGNTLTVQATTPPSVLPSYFLSDSNVTRIKVPQASVEAYKKAQGWSKFASIISGY